MWSNYACSYLPATCSYPPHYAQLHTTYDIAMCCMYIHAHCGCKIKLIYTHMHTHTHMCTQMQKSKKVKPVQLPLQGHAYPVKFGLISVLHTGILSQYGYMLGLVSSWRLAMFNGGWCGHLYGHIWTTITYWKQY